MNVLLGARGCQQRVTGETQSEALLQGAMALADNVAMGSTAQAGLVEFMAACASRWSTAGPHPLDSSLACVVWRLWMEWKGDRV